MVRLVLLFLFLGVAISDAAGDDPLFRDRLSQMTLERKIAQMFMVSFFGTHLAEIERDFLREVQPGAVVLFGRNVESPRQVTALTNTYQETVVAAGGVPLLIAVDQEGGRVQRLQDGFTRFPAPMLWTAGGNDELAYEVGRAMAVELRLSSLPLRLALMWLWWRISG